MSLFIKIDFGGTPSTDDGTRPYTGSTPFWNNASIFMVGGPSQTQTSVGTATTVRVRVSNSSQATVEDVNVDAYVMNPFVGAFDPNNAVVTLKGFATQIAPGSGSPSATDSHVVPCLVQGGGGPVPWTPTQQQLDNSTDGHLCLVANCYADGDGSSQGVDTPFAVSTDPHLGQRNIALLPGSKVQHFTFQVMPALDGQATALDFLQLPALVARQRAEFWLLRSRTNVSLLDGTSVGLGFPKRGTRPAIPFTLSRKAPRGTIEIEGLGGLDLGEVVRASKRFTGLAASAGARVREWGDGRLVMPAARAATTATLALDRADTRGSIQAFDIVQRDAGGRILGGLRILSVQG